MPAEILYFGCHKGFSHIYFLANRKKLGEISIGQEFYSRESFMLPNIQNVGQDAQFPYILKIL